MQNFLLGNLLRKYFFFFFTLIYLILKDSMSVNILTRDYILTWLNVVYIIIIRAGIKSYLKINDSFAWEIQLLID